MDSGQTEQVRSPRGKAGGDFAFEQDVDAAGTFEVKASAELEVKHIECGAVEEIFQCRSWRSNMKDSWPT